MKGFKDVCKLNAALCRVLRVDFKRDLDSFRNALPDVDYEEGTSVELPSRDCFDFLLIRLIAICELYKRISDCCLDAAEYFTCQIRLCYFFEISTLFLAVIAKIYHLSIKLTNIAVDLYNSSLPSRLKLPPNAKSKFLKEKPFDFPEKLEIVKLSVLEKKQDSIVKEEPLKDLLQKEDKLKTVVKAQNLKKTDVGEEIQRSSKVQQKTFNIEQLNTVDAIKRYIENETKARNKSLKEAVTAKILSHEWAGATKLFERKVQSGEAKKAINIFRKFLTLKIV